MDRTAGRVAGFALWLGLATQGLAETPPAVISTGPLPGPTNEDLRHLRAIADPQLSPDGRRVLVRVTESTADGALSHIWLTDVAGGKARQLTFTRSGDKRGERAGRWSADGESLFFLAKRGEQTQIFRLPLAGGEAVALTLETAPKVDASTLPGALPPAKADDPTAKAKPLPLDVESFDVGHDGKTLAVLATDPQTPGEKAQEDAKADAVWVDHDLHGARLYLFDATTEKLTSTAVPTDVKTVAWSPAGDKLIVTTEAANNAGDLGPASAAWLVATHDPDHPARLTEVPPTVELGTWSKDGTRYVLLARPRPTRHPATPTSTP